MLPAPAADKHGGARPGASGGGVPRQRLNNLLAELASPLRRHQLIRRTNDRRPVPDYPILAGLFRLAYSSRTAGGRRRSTSLNNQYKAPKDSARPPRPSRVSRPVLA